MIERNNRISNAEAQALELFRQLRPEQKKAVLLSVILSSLAAEGTKTSLDGREAHNAIL